MSQSALYRRDRRFPVLSEAVASGLPPSGRDEHRAR